MGNEHSPLTADFPLLREVAGEESTKQALIGRGKSQVKVGEASEALVERDTDMVEQFVIQEEEEAPEIVVKSMDQAISKTVDTAECRGYERSVPGLYQNTGLSSTSCRYQAPVKVDKVKQKPNVVSNGVSQAVGEGARHWKRQIQRVPCSTNVQRK
ncbi:hypothetical protein SUGI_1088450 [Cryptomeria japonica]|nr:hypothetical protein SUGI_1088450 [Cryptomeria japonica]